MALNTFWWLFVIFVMIICHMNILLFEVLRLALFLLYYVSFFILYIQWVSNPLWWSWLIHKSQLLKCQEFWELLGSLKICLGRRFYTTYTLGNTKTNKEKNKKTGKLVAKHFLAYHWIFMLDTKTFVGFFFSTLLEVSLDGYSDSQLGLFLVWLGLLVSYSYLRNILKRQKSLPLPWLLRSFPMVSLKALLLNLLYLFLFRF